MSAGQGVLLDAFAAEISAGALTVRINAGIGGAEEPAGPEEDGERFGSRAGSACDTCLVPVGLLTICYRCH